jgi:chemotaxis protein methyltransferase CheR
MSVQQAPWQCVAGLTPGEFDRVRALVRDRAAIALEPDRMPLVEARLVALARREGFASIEALLEGLRAEGPAGSIARRVVEAMTTHETAFFRDFHPFEALRTTILPRLLDQLEGGRPLHIWCGAASTGQEPHSVAMLLRTHFPGVDARIVATDVSRAVLARCESGRYSSLEVNRGLPARLLVRYFDEAGLDWQLAEDLLGMVSLQPLNLAAEWPDWPRFDLVLMRHVLMYFDRETRTRVLQRVHGQMNSGGCLLLGSGEVPAGLANRFDEVRDGRAVWYRARANGDGA